MQTRTLGSEGWGPLRQIHSRRASTGPGRTGVIEEPGSQFKKPNMDNVEKGSTMRTKEQLGCNRTMK